MKPHPSRFNWQITFIYLIMIGLSACSPLITPTGAPSGSSPTPTHTPNIASPTAVQQNSTPPACVETRGSLLDVQLPASMLKYPLAVKIYLPPCYAVERSKNYPTLYMLHGMTDTNEQWVNLGLTDEADHLINAKTIQPMLIVMPYEINWQLSPDQSGYGEAITDLLIPWVEKNYRVCTDRDCRAIGGLSRGGNWAVKLGFDHWQLFSAVGAHSTPLFIGGILDLTNAIRKLPSTAEAPAIYLDAGLKDENLLQITEFEKTLTDLKIDHEYHLNTGSHDAVYWSAHVEEYLLWYSGQLRK